jgi:hypothetical protein
MVHKNNICRHAKIVTALEGNDLLRSSQSIWLVHEFKKKMKEFPKALPVPEDTEQLAPAFLRS